MPKSSKSRSKPSSKASGTSKGSEKKQKSKGESAGKGSSKKSKKRQKSKESKREGSPSSKDSKKELDSKEISETWETSEEEYQSLVEYDVDERLFRSENPNPKKIKYPKEVATESSRILAVVEPGFNPELSDEAVLPDFDTLSPSQCVESLGELMGLEDHENNFASFWMLDIFSEVVRRSTKFEMSPKNQKIVIAWLGYIIKGISINGGTREELFSNIIDVLLESAENYNPGDDLPDPRKIFDKLLHYKLEAIPVEDNLEVSVRESLKTVITEESFAEHPSLKKIRPLGTERDVDKSIGDETLISTATLKGSTLKVRFIDEMMSQIQSKHLSTMSPVKGETLTIQDTECLDNDLIFLTEEIYQLLGNRFSYEVVKSTFATPPEIIPVTIVESMDVPKVVKYPELAEEETPESAEKPESKGPKGKKDKGKKSAKKKGKGKKTASAGKSSKKSTAKSEKSAKSSTGDKKGGKKKKTASTAKGSKQKSRGSKKGKSAKKTKEEKVIIPDFLQLPVEDTEAKQKELMKYEQVLPLEAAVSNEFYDRLFPPETEEKAPKSPKKSKKKGASKKDKKKGKNNKKGKTKSGKKK